MLLIILDVMVKSSSPSHAYSGDLCQQGKLILECVRSMRIRIFAGSPGWQEAGLLLVAPVLWLCALFPLCDYKLIFRCCAGPFFLFLFLQYPSHFVAHRPLKMVSPSYYFPCPCLVLCLFSSRSCCCKACRRLGIIGALNLLVPLSALDDFIVVLAAWNFVPPWCPPSLVEPQLLSCLLWAPLSCSWLVLMLLVHSCRPAQHDDLVQVPSSLVVKL